MKKTYLAVPFEKKEEFKEVCRKENLRYFWDKEARSWGIEWEGSLQLPRELEEFLPEGMEANGKGAMPLPSGPPRVHVIDCDFMYMPFASKAGARWDAKRRVATFRGHTLPTELTGFGPKPFSHQEKMERELNKEPVKARKPTRKITPHSHQEEARDAIVKGFGQRLPGFLLADATGLGKTISAWMAIQEMARTKPGDKPLKVLISGPLTALETWRETILWMGNLGTDGKRLIDVTLINYERLRNLFEEDGKKAKTLKGIARFAKSEEHDILVFDESHYLKTPTSARTKLARKLEEEARFTIWLSATAGQNPLELAYLSNLLGHQTGHKGKTLEKEFESWCQSQGIGVKRGKFGKWIWDGANEKENEIVHRILFKKGKSGVVGALRRRCEDIAGWPEIQRIPRGHWLEPVEFSAYQAEWKAFLKALEEDRLGGLAGKKDNSKGIAQLGRLRQKASLLRTPATAELAEELLDQGYQVAISVEYLMTLDQIREALEKKGYVVAEFSGRNSAGREAERLRYQKGEADVIIFSTESSISLHQLQDTDRPRAQINHDLRWSAIEQEQVDGRSHRNGRHAPVYWSFSKDTVEERVATILLKKMESMNQLRGDQGGSADFGSIYREISEGNKET
jgi:SNF2 family DNA or RNA helicase